MPSVLQEFEATQKTVPPTLPADTQQVCIDLPGEAIRCVIHKPKLVVRLRKHRDVVFDINLSKGTNFTVEADQSDFYNARDKKIVLVSKRQKVHFADGERLHLWVGRNFKGSLILKQGNIEWGRYSPATFDSVPYGDDPKVKPEPMVIAIGTKSAAPLGQCTPTDPFGIAGNHEAQKALISQWIRDAQAHGTTFDYLQYTSLNRSPETSEQEYVVVTVAEVHEVLPQVRESLRSTESIQGSPAEIFAPVSAASVLTVASEKFGETLLQNSWKETAGYVQEHWRRFGQLGMTVSIEKAKLGKYRVVFRGRMLIRVARNAAAQGAGWAMKKKTVSAPLGTPGSAWLDGGFGKTGKAGLGGAKRITLTSAANFKTGMKIQMIDTIIDLYGDYDKVFGEKGNNDLSEFLGRAGVSVAKAGATAALGALFAAGIVAIGAALAVTAPVWLALGLVVGGYILAATVVDLIDEGLQIKERAALIAR